MNHTAIHTRMLSQQLAAPQFNNATDLVQWFGAIQAQDLRSLKQALLIRLKGSERNRIKTIRTAWDSGNIIRMHNMRMTLQLVPRELVRPLQRMCYNRNITTFKGWCTYKRIELPQTMRNEANEALLSIISGKSMPRSAIVEQLYSLRIAPTKELARWLITNAEIEGLICSGMYNDEESTFTLLDERIGTDSMTDTEALTYLARAYFRSHSPAALDDFVWWTGLNKSRCKTAIESISDELTEIHIDRQPFYLHCNARTRGFKKGQTVLLPAYDEYLIGYKSRHLVLPADIKHLAHSNTCIFYPVVIQNGIVIEYKLMNT